MKITAIVVSTVVTLAATLALHAQEQAATQDALTSKFAFEQMPVLSASAILRPEYCKGLFFSVRDQVPTNSGWNLYTIDSEFGVFEAKGNMMLMRTVAELTAIGALQAMSQNKEFMNAVEKSAKVPLVVAENLVNKPGDTIASVPKGIFGFLNSAGQAVTDTVSGRKGSAAEGSTIDNISGFSKVKRDLAMKLGVDPYSSNDTFQKALNKAAWPIFLGNISVQAGMSCVGGPAGKALFAFNTTGKLGESLRDLDPADLRVKNLAALKAMGISKADGDAYLNNTLILPSIQTVTVNALAELGQIPGRDDFIREAAGSDSELMAFSYQYTAQMMANLNRISPITSIAHTVHLTVCQNKNGSMLIPLEWDYAEWSPLVNAFVPAVKEVKLPSPVTGHSLVITGVASPTTVSALAAANMNLTTKALPGPLK